MASYLDDFQDSHRALIVSLPVRIGLWMSSIDDIAGTDRDDEKEMLALEKAMEKVMKKTSDKAFSNDVVEFALIHKVKWPVWGQEEGDVLEDLERALKIIKDTLSADALAAYKKTIYFVAAVVAQAAAERGGEDDLSGEMMGAGLLHKLLDRLSVKTDLKMPDNISPKEKAALQKLLQVLKA